MSRASWLVALCALVVGCLGAASAQPPPGTAFAWNEYTGQDGKTYVYPRWVDNGDATVSFFTSSGTLAVGKTWTATAAKMRLVVPGPLPGSWVLSFEDGKATISAKDVTFNTHILSGKDPNELKKKFAPGSDVRITWIVTLKDARNVEVEVTFGPDAHKAQNTLKK